LSWGCTVAKDFVEIGPPGVVDEVGIGAKTFEQSLDVLGVGAKFLGDHF